MNGARARGSALGLLVVGAALMLLAGGRQWFSGRALTDGLPSLPIHISGRDVAPIVSAVGLLALAGAGLVLFVGTRLRRLVAVVVLVAALGALWRCADVLLHSGSTTFAIVRRTIEAATPVTGGSQLVRSAWPWVAVVGSLLVVAGAVLVLVTVGSWPRPSRRYEEDGPSAPPPSSDESAATPPPGPVGDAPTDELSDAMWKALDRGEDPTD